MQDFAQDVRTGDLELNSGLLSPVFIQFQLRGIPTFSPLKSCCIVRQENGLEVDHELHHYDGLPPQGSFGRGGGWVW